MEIEQGDPRSDLLAQVQAARSAGTLVEEQDSPEKASVLSQVQAFRAKFPGLEVVPPEPSFRDKTAAVAATATEGLTKNLDKWGGLLGVPGTMRDPAPLVGTTPEKQSDIKMLGRAGNVIDKLTASPWERGTPTQGELAQAEKQLQTLDVQADRRDFEARRLDPVTSAVVGTKAEIEAMHDTVNEAGLWAKTAGNIMGLVPQMAALLVPDPEKLDSEYPLMMLSGGAGGAVVKSGFGKWIIGKVFGKAGSVAATLVENGLRGSSTIGTFSGSGAALEGASPQQILEATGEGVVLGGLLSLPGTVFAALRHKAPEVVSSLIEEQQRIYMTEKIKADTIKVDEAAVELHRYQKAVERQANAQTKWQSKVWQEMDGPFRQAIWEANPDELSQLNTMVFNAKVPASIKQKFIGAIEAGVKDKAEFEAWYGKPEDTAAASAKMGVEGAYKSPDQNLTTTYLGPEQGIADVPPEHLVTVYHGSKIPHPNFDPTKTNYQNPAVYFSSHPGVAKDFLSSGADVLGGANPWGGVPGAYVSAKLDIRTIFDPRIPEHAEQLRKIADLGIEALDAETLIEKGSYDLYQPGIVNKLKKLGFKGHVEVESSFKSKDSKGAAINYAVYDPAIIHHPKTIELAEYAKIGDWWDKTVAAWQWVIGKGPHKFVNETGETFFAWASLLPEPMKFEQMVEVMEGAKAGKIADAESAARQKVVEQQAQPTEAADKMVMMVRSMEQAIHDFEGSHPPPKLPEAPVELPPSSDYVEKKRTKLGYVRDYILDSGVRLLKKHGGTPGNIIAQQIEIITQDEKANYNKGHLLLIDTLKTVPWEERKNIGPYAEGYLKNAHPSVVRAAEIMQGEFDRQLAAYAEVGGKRVMPDGTILPPKGSGHWFPQVPNDVGLEILRDSRKGGMPSAKLTKALDKLVATGWAPTADEALARLKNYDLAQQSKAPGLWYPRQSELPQWMREWDPVKVLPRAMVTNWRAIAVTRQWGWTASGVLPDLMPHLTALREMGVHLAGETERFIKVLFDNPDPTWRQFTGVMGKVKMAQFYGKVALNLPAIIINGIDRIGKAATFGGPVLGAKALAMYPPVINMALRPWLTGMENLRRQGILSGAVTGGSAIGEDIRFHSKVAKVAGWAFSKSEEGNQVTLSLIASMKLQRDVSAFMLLHDQHPLTKRLRGYLTLGEMSEESIKRRVHEYGLDQASPQELRGIVEQGAKSLRDGSPNPEVINRAMLAMVQKGAYPLDPTVMSMWWPGRPVLQTLTQFKTWPLRQLNLLFGHAVRETTLGNFAPLLGFVTGSIIAGELGQEIRDLVSGADRSIASGVIRGSVKSDEEWLKRVGMDMAQGGAFGLLSSLAYGLESTIVGPSIGAP
jgi:hypothetical protein